MLDKESAEIQSKRKLRKAHGNAEANRKCRQDRSSDIRVVTKEREGSGNRKRNIVRT